MTANTANFDTNAKQKDKKVCMMVYDLNKCQ